MKNQLKKIGTNAYQKILLVTIFFLPLSLYIKMPLYVDEADNLIGARVLVEGGQIYRDYYSQHTPLMYFIMAIPTKFGFTTLIELRVYFYILLAAIMTMIIMIFRKYFSQSALIAGGLIYFSSFISNQAVSYAILSDQVQALMYIFLMLTLLKFATTKTLNRKDVFLVSIASFVAISVAFISIYFIFIFIIGLIHIKLNSLYLESQVKSVAYYRNLIFQNTRKLLTIIAIMAAPHVLAIIYLASYGNLGNFIQQSFTLNREVYVIYSAFGGSFIQPFLDGIKYILSDISQLGIPNSNGALLEIRKWANIIAPIFFSILLFTNKRLRVASYYLLALVSISAMRGTQGFHATPFWALASFTIAFGISSKWNSLLASPNNREDRFEIEIHRSKVPAFHASIGNLNSTIRPLKRFGGVLLVISMVIPNLTLLDDIVNGKIGTRISSDQEITKEFLINNTLKPGERFFTTSLDLKPFITTESTPAARTAFVVPWFTQEFETQIIEDLKSQKTPLVFHNADSGFSGNNIQNYATRLNKFILDNYTVLDGDFNFRWVDWISGKTTYQPLDSVYILNSRFQETLDKFRALRPEIFGSRIGFQLLPTSSQLRTGEILDNSIVRQDFLVNQDNFRSIHLLFTKYGNIVTSSYRLRLKDKDGTLIVDEVIDARKIDDNSFYVLQFNPIESSKGQTYSLEILPNQSLTEGQYNATTGNSLLIWISDPDKYLDGKLFIGGAEFPNDLIMRLGFKR